MKTQMFKQRVELKIDIEHENCNDHIELCTKCFIKIINARNLARHPSGVL